MAQERCGRGRRRLPKSVTRGSFAEYIAALTLETGIAPNDLLNAPIEVLESLEDLIERRKAAERQKGRR
jgi:hypothetical protein